MPALTTPAVLRSWIEALDTPSQELTKWEADFVESVRVQFELRGSLSTRQAEILERIYAEKTS